MWDNFGLKVFLYLHGQITAKEVAPENAFITLLLQGRTEEANLTLETWLSGEVVPRISRASRSQVFHGFSILGRPQNAIEYSKSYLARIGTPMGKMGAYYETVDRYVCGEASTEDLLAAAENSSTRRRHRIDAHYLLGLERLSKSDRQEAVKHFEEIERAGNYVFCRRVLTPVLLKRLRDDPEWPPWIPPSDPAGASQK